MFKVVIENSLKEYNIPYVYVDRIKDCEFDDMAGYDVLIQQGADTFSAGYMFHMNRLMLCEFYKNGVPQFKYNHDADKDISIFYNRVKETID